MCSEGDTPISSTPSNVAQGDSVLLLGLSLLTCERVSKFSWSGAVQGLTLLTLVPGPALLKGVGPMPAMQISALGTPGGGCYAWIPGSAQRGVQGGWAPAGSRPLRGASRPDQPLGICLGTQVLSLH